MKKIYAVIDTNVIFSALFTKKTDVATVKVLEAFYSGKIKAVVHSGILEEYKEVLSRPKFHFPPEIIETTVNAFASNGIFLDRTEMDVPVKDAKDVVFYEVTLTAKDVFDEAYLITGNGKHFPIKPFVVTPAEMVKILEDEERK